VIRGHTDGCESLNAMWSEELLIKEVMFKFFRRNEIEARSYKT
jgi:hypothetical protein